MNLAEKMDEWGILKYRADMLERQIKEEVLQLSSSQSVGIVTARYSKGRGSYDYEQIARVVEPNIEIVEKHRKISYDWKSICEESGASKKEMEMFYKEGSPSVTLKLSEEFAE